jgi:hypothetical protein
MPEPTDLDLISLHATALFNHDPTGRITGSNEPIPMAAPRLYIGRSPEGNVWRFGTSVPADLASRLNEVLRHEPPASDLEAPPRCLQRLTDLLATQAPVTDVASGPAWLVPSATAIPDGALVTSSLSPTQIEEADQLFASDLAPSLPYAAVVVDGGVASLCSCSRITPEVAEAGLVTVPEHRGHGFAAAATAAWAAAVRATGRLPLYSTGWDNLASRRVAAKLNLRLYGADFSMR